MDFTLIFPEELVEKIFSYLTADDLFRAACCNKAWRRWSNSDIMWQSLCAARNWLKFDTDLQLFTKCLYNCTATELTSPAFNSVGIADISTLPRACHWKDIYIRASYLNQNWEKGRYTVVPPLRGHRKRVNCLDCDGKFLVSGSEDNTARIWGLFTAHCLHVFDCHRDAVTSVVIKNGYILTGCADSLIRVFEVETWKYLRCLTGHSSGIDHLCFDGKKVLSASADR
nr:PREDICTED: F-box/WD repeat-containing protein 7-like [Latimeria chalumnae]|eukprot:XP_014340536.1 PREDICTED: F-box/WD repeat-containing protein 7-like [Latimeria chalumnae]